MQHLYSLTWVIQAEREREIRDRRPELAVLPDPCHAHPDPAESAAARPFGLAGLVALVRLAWDGGREATDC